MDYRGTFSDIRLDPELDDALFRLEPPAGYTLRKADARINMTFEEAVARWLRNYTKASGGRFPARLDDFDDYAQGGLARPPKKAKAKEAKTKEAKGILDPAILRGRPSPGAFLAGFCQKYKDQYGYKPDGVKLGDAKAIIFWYKPEGQDEVQGRLRRPAHRRGDGRGASGETQTVIRPAPVARGWVEKTRRVARPTEVLRRSASPRSLAARPHPTNGPFSPAPRSPS